MGFHIATERLSCGCPTALHARVLAEDGTDVTEAHTIFVADTDEGELYVMSPEAAPHAPRGFKPVTAVSVPVLRVLRGRWRVRCARHPDVPVE